MEQENTYYQELIARYFSGEAREKEQAELDAWVRKSPDNLHVFEEYRQTWLLLQQTRVEEQTDVDQEWEMMKVKLQSPSGPKTIPLYDPEEEEREQKIHFRKIFRIAAAILVLAVSSFFAWQYLFRENIAEHKLTASQKPLEAKLPDGSHITLNNGSTLTYPEKFTGGNRKVSLQGEAYFQVQPDKEKPFIISAGNFSVEVLGTSFYVNTGMNGDTAMVVVNTGRVAVYKNDKPSERIILEAGDKTIISTTVKPLEKKVNDDINYLSWKTGKIDFRNDRLDKITYTLSRIYRTQIKLTNPDLSNCRITGTYNTDMKLEAVLNVLKETLGVEYKKTSEGFEISGKGCEE
ncbi:MAG: FecR domain-containing protein [Bacteroidota bacterium]